ncbi:MAG: ankyrin repeat domain-containing protein, partial [Planctomycetota bacterium]
FAARGGHKDMIELLVAKGADTNARTTGNLTPLDLAEQEGHTEIVELLRKHRAKE